MDLYTLPYAGLLPWVTTLPACGAISATWQLPSRHTCHLLLLYLPDLPCWTGFSTHLLILHGSPHLPGSHAYWKLITYAYVATFFRVPLQYLHTALHAHSSLLISHLLPACWTFLGC